MYEGIGHWKTLYCPTVGYWSIVRGVQKAIHDAPNLLCVSLPGEQTPCVVCEDADIDADSARGEGEDGGTKILAEESGIGRGRGVLGEGNSRCCIFFDAVSQQRFRFYTMLSQPPS